MNTQIFEMEEHNIDASKLEKAGEIIRNGGLVAFPTETVYGLGANAYDDTAVKKIYGAKGRPSDNPLIVHFAEVSDIEAVAAEMPPRAHELLEKFSPGPLTVILKRNDRIGNTVTAGLDTVAVRIPVNELAREFIRRAGVPIAAPSANLSGKPSPTAPEHVINDMSGRIEAIIAGGECDVGVESTIVDMSCEPPTLLRPGGITLSELRTVLPDIVPDRHILQSVEENERPKCPGMKYKHYAPDAQVVVIEGKIENIRRKIKELIAENSGKKIGVLTVGEYSYSGAEVILSAGGGNKEYAHKLFFSLRRFDELGAELVFAEFCDDEEYGLAVRNRLYKAAGGTVIHV